MDTEVSIVISFILGLLSGTGIGLAANQKMEGFACTQSSIVNGEAECVEYRRVEE